jgi:hypothetical protein
MVSGTFPSRSAQKWCQESSVAKTCRASFGDPLRDGVDQDLIVVTVGALGDREGVSVRLGLEGRRADVGHPDLDWSQALPAQPCTVRPNLVAR